MGGIAQHWHTAMFLPSTTSHANYSSICSPSLYCAFTPHLPSSLSFLPSPLLCSSLFLFCSRLIISSSSPFAVRPRQLSVVGIGPQRSNSTFNLSLIFSHCNGKWFCVLLFDWGSKPTPHHRGTLSLRVGGVFNFAFAQIVFYQKIHISNMILHINHGVCKWPNRRTGGRKTEPVRKWELN